MLSHSKSSSNLVPVLVDKFTDIIEWKAKVLQKEIQSFEAQKVAQAKLLPHLDPRRFSVPELELLNPLQRSNSGGNIKSAPQPGFPKLKRSKSQKCFSRKLNKVRAKANRNTIEEDEYELPDFDPHELDSVSERLAKFKKQYRISANTVLPKPKSEPKVRFADENNNPIRNEETKVEVPKNNTNKPQIANNTVNKKPEVKTISLPVKNGESKSTTNNSDNKDNVITDLKQLKYNLIRLSMESRRQQEQQQTPEPQTVNNNKSLNNVSKVSVEPKKAAVTDESQVSNRNIKPVETKIDQEYPVNNNKNNTKSANNSTPTPIKQTKVICEDSKEVAVDSKPTTKLTPVEPPKPTYNVLLEKLRNVYRHNFDVKTVVVDIKSRIAEALGKKPALDEGQCLCGEAFSFSDKTLQCILCLTKCHTTCAPTIPTPCVRFVDLNLRPSKLISTFVYPRSKPAIPSLLIQLVREIEAKCSGNTSGSKDSQQLSSCLLHAKLYYVESEQLKLVKDEVKRLLSQGKLGLQRLDHLNLDHLCGMVKHFLANVCEPVFTSLNWKQFSVNIHKKSEDELTGMILDTFDSMPPACVHTLCFMLLHLKHLNRCGYQDLDILADIFCPILLGDVEVRRKGRLMKLMFALEDNVLLSFVES